MGKRKPVELRELRFNTQKEAKAFFGSILNAHEEGEELEGEEFNYVEQLLENHPRASEKIGVGIERIVVGLNPERNGKCFYVVRKDNSFDDFSYHRCIDGEPNAFTTFAAACRRAVYEDIQDFRAKISAEIDHPEGKVKCAISGQMIHWRDAVIDHKPPKTFSVLVNLFQVAKQIDMSKIEYDRELIGGVKFRDKKLSEEFRQFHRQAALLRVVSRHKNSATAHQGRITPTKQDRVLQQNA